MCYGFIKFNKIINILSSIIYNKYRSGINLDEKGVQHMHKYMTIHTTETGDHANFFEHLFNAYEFYHDMIDFGYSVALYEMNENSIYWPKMHSWIDKEDEHNA